MASTRKGLFSWALYDWANSSYFVIIQTFVFAAYFTRAIAENETIGTSQWGNTISLAGITIALLAPFFGAIADQGGCRKPWIGWFTVLCVFACGMLWFATPGADSVFFALSFVFLATVGAEFAFVFYSAMLPDLVSKDNIGRWSGWGWGLGYAGGLSCLLVALYAFIETDGAWLGLDPEHAEPVRATFLLTAIWYFVFSIPLFVYTPDQPATKIPILAAVRTGLNQLVQTLKKAREYKNIVRFLIAKMFYTDGVATIFAMGGVYAAGTFDMDESQILMFGVGLNITAGLGAFGFAWLDDKAGSKKTIILSLLGLMIPLAALLFVQSISAFIIWGLLLGVFVGPVQAASRTFMGRLAPENMRSQMFGLYALSGKITSFIGPFMTGVLTVWFASQRIGMSFILILLILGLFILLRVEEV